LSEQADNTEREASPMATKTEDKTEEVKTERSPILSELETLVLRSEESKGQPTPISDLLARVDALDALVKSQQREEPNYALVERLGETLPQITKGLDMVTRLSTILLPFSESVDRTQGDALVSAFNNLRAAHVMLTDSDITEGEALVARWVASAPTPTKSTGKRASTDGAPTFPPLGFKVSYKCQTCGKTFSTRTNNLNSARNECVKHARDAHGALIGEGTSDFDALGRALVTVGLTPKGALPADLQGTAERADGGGWRIEKSA
jgi:hypothetical protein